MCEDKPRYDPNAAARRRATEVEATYGTPFNSRTWPFDAADYLDRVFNYHPPFGDQPVRYQEIREAGRGLASTILRDCPSSNERTLALRAIESAVMWANAAIARNEVQPPMTPYPGSLFGAVGPSGGGGVSGSGGGGGSL